jgi:hypothetical protein
MTVRDGLPAPAKVNANVAIRAEKTGNRQIDQFQRTVADVLTTILASPFATGKPILAVILVANTPKVIQHGLGRAYSNWIVTRIQATTAPSFMEVAQSPSSLNGSQITLQATHNCTINLWVS